MYWFKSKFSFKYNVPNKENIDVHPYYYYTSKHNLLSQLFSLLFNLGDILEIGAQWAIAKKDTTAFERYMAQLKCYYMDYK